MLMTPLEAMLFPEAEGLAPGLSPPSWGEARPRDWAGSEANIFGLQNQQFLATFVSGTFHLCPGPAPPASGHFSLVWH